jgi:cystathionine beta-lyase
MTTVVADPLEMLRRRTSEKWTTHPPDVLPLFVAETDYPLAPAIAERLHESIRLSDTGYVSSAGPLAPAFAGFAERAWTWRIDPAGVRTTADVSVAIVETLRSVISPGDRVIINPPVYPPFYDLIPEAGGQVVEVPLLDDGAGWQIDLAGVEAAFRAGARVYLLCNPQNPVGLVHSRETLEAIAELAARYDAIVVSDEIHAPLTHAGVAFVPFLTVSDAAREHGVTVTSASKGWNLAGLKCGLFVAASERTTAILDGMPEEVGTRTGLLGLHASVAAYTDSVDWLHGAIAAMESNAELLGELLAVHLPQLGFRRPRASYLAWLDFRPLGWGDDPSIRALELARVALVPGPTFGPQGRGFARLNFACSPEMLREAVERLAAAV